MKRLSIAACVLAIVAAFATHVNSKPVLATAYGSSTCLEGSLVGTCNGGSVQCKVMIPNVSPNPDAWQDTGCSVQFSRD